MFRSLDHPQGAHIILAKVSVETVNTLLHVSVMQQHIVCMLYPLQGGRSTDRPPCKDYILITNLMH